MALIVLTSANGSPGVTTSALGLAMAWPRPTVLIDADPTGARAIPAGYFRGSQLPTDLTIVDLAVSHRQGTLAEDLPHMLVRIPDTHVQFLCGPLRHTQARSLESLWEPLSGVLKGLERTGQDVIVDAGRLGLEGSPFPLLMAADVAMLATRSTLPALVAASSWAPTLRNAFTRTGAESSLAVLLVGQGMPYGSGEVAKVLDMPVAATLAWDPTTAEVLSCGAKPSRKFASSPLSKSLRAAVQALRAASSHDDLDLVSGERSLR